MNGVALRLKFNLFLLNCCSDSQEQSRRKIEIESNSTGLKSNRFVVSQFIVQKCFQTVFDICSISCSWIRSFVCLFLLNV